MFKNVYEKEYNGFFMKLYSYDEDFNVAINRIIYSDIPFSKVSVIKYLNDGMKYYNVEYSYSEFLMKFDNMNASINKIVLYFSNMPGSIIIDNLYERISVLTNSKDIDLNELIGIKHLLK